MSRFFQKPKTILTVVFSYPFSHSRLAGFGYQIYTLYSPTHPFKRIETRPSAFLRVLDLNFVCVCENVGVQNPQDESEKTEKPKQRRFKKQY